MKKRWIVRNKLYDPKAGNGVWHGAFTYRAADKARKEIESGTWRGGHYSLPVNVLVCRAELAFRPIKPCLWCGADIEFDDIRRSPCFRSPHRVHEASA